jgi:polar amino acid transport system permease protein
MRIRRSSNLQRFYSRTTYYTWVVVFFLMLTGIITALYFATMKTNYTWRWNRVPRYFAYQAEIEIRAELDGDVTELVTDGAETTIRIKGKEATQAYRVPTAALRVSKGDLISTGDLLAVSTKWKAGLMLQGIWMTLQVSVYSIVLGIIIGVCGGISRLSSNPALKWFSTLYVEIIRGSPLLVQIYIWYFVLGTMINDLLRRAGISEISPVGYGVIALSVFIGAYITETVRAGIQSIHRGQIEASRSLGMSYAQAMQHIILPQALRRILPPLAGDFIGLIKDSSLLGIIAVRELTKATREAVTTSLQPFEFFFTCALMYLVLTFTLSMLVQYLERRTSVS